MDLIFIILDPSLSSPLSSISDEITSEQSGWVSNSSRHSSGSQLSSGGLSPEAQCRKEYSEYSTSQMKKLKRFNAFEPVLNGEVLIKK